MNWKILMLILLATCKCDKLNKEENENRLAMCGNVRRHGECTGTIISPRHVLTATHCVAETSPNSDRFSVITMNRKTINKEDCIGDDYIIEDSNDAKKVLFYSKNGQKIPGKKIWMLSGCKRFTQTTMVDITLIELEMEFTFGDYAQMACVSDDMSDVAAGVTLNFYGYGSKPTEGTNYDDRTVGFQLLHETSFIFQPRFVFRGQKPQSGERSDEELTASRSPSEDTIACAGDSGGGATRLIRGRTTVVGVASQTTCAAFLRKWSGTEYFAAVASKKDKICEYGGICSESSGINHALIGFIVSCYSFYRCL